MTLKMAGLRAAFEALGLADAATYGQSGNVVFSAQATDPDGLARRLAEQLKRSLGYQGPVFVLAQAELADAVAHNPFDPATLDRVQACHLMFLSRQPAAPRYEALLALQGEQYRFATYGRVLYYAYPRALAGRRRTIDFEKVLGVAGTARSWKVAGKLLQLAGHP